LLSHLEVLVTKKFRVALKARRPFIGFGGCLRRTRSFRVGIAGRTIGLGNPYVFIN
jgi:hypothetical protein